MALITQEMMDLTGIPQNAPRKHDNFKDWLADPQIDEDKKYRLIWQAAHFETLNGFTKKDITYEKGSREMHMTRNTMYKLQKRALTNLTKIYNTHAS